MFSLLAGDSVTELANTGITKGEPTAAETAVVGADDQPTGPSILILNAVSYTHLTLPTIYSV